VQGKIKGKMHVPAPQPLSSIPSQSSSAVFPQISVPGIISPAQALHVPAEHVRLPPMQTPTP